MLLWAWVAGSFAASPAGDASSRCPDCHGREAREFGCTRMAVAAGSPEFLEEWGRRGRAGRCLACHAPGGGEGVVCRDCHGGSGHPYPVLATPQICAGCHDAPGEATVRSFKRSPAARRGESCLDCHLPDKGGGHDFMGPARSGFLEGAARLDISLRRDGAVDTALIRIRHRAGHNLPGGTTGRSVWLVVETFSREERPLARSEYRFGWYRDAGGGWLDRTLPPGPGKVIEVALRGGAAALIEARLIYRFRPGPLEEADSRDVLLDHAAFELPGQMGDGR
jgi:hypothetical protein